MDKRAEKRRSKLKKVEISEQMLMKLSICQYTSGERKTTDHVHLAKIISRIHSKPLPIIEVIQPEIKPTRKEKLIQDANLKKPEFLLKRLDSAGRSASEPDFDEGTLLISEEQFNKLTPGMQRYWDLKRKVMDSVLFYRFGDWYVLYFDDLDLCNKHIQLSVTPHIGNHQIGFHSREL